MDATCKRSEHVYLSEDLRVASPLEYSQFTNTYGGPTGALELVNIVYCKEIYSYLNTIFKLVVLEGTYCVAYT